MTMDSHDEPLDEPWPDRAETEKLLRGIALAAVPHDRDSLLWACGYEAGKGATSRVTPTAGGTIRAWLPFLASTAAAFFVGYVFAGPFSSSGAIRDTNPDVANSAPRVPKPLNDNPPRPASATGRVEKPRDGLYASVPPNRLEELLAVPSVPPELRGIALPPDRPPLRVRNGLSGLDSIDL